MLTQRKKDLAAWDNDTQADFFKFFGTKDDEARKKILDRIDKTYQKLNSFGLENFEPDDDAYAYVYPDKEDTIYLGEGFADAPDIGMNSKAGTLIHEVSHYNSVGGTEDHEYGIEENIKLASKSSNKALNNADSFEYFMETADIN